MYQKNCPINRTDGPIRVQMPPPVDYTDMIHYIKTRPEKLVSFVADRLCDDDMRPFARELYGHLLGELTRRKEEMP